MKTPEEHYEAVMNGTHPQLLIQSMQQVKGQYAHCQLFDHTDKGFTSGYGRAPMLALLCAISSWQKKGGV